MTLQRNIDTSMLLMTAALDLYRCCYGHLFILAIMATERFGDGFLFSCRQAVYTLVGFVVLCLATYFNYENWRKLAVISLLISIACWHCYWFPVSVSRSVVRVRWLRLPGMTLQPAELVKLTLVLYSPIP